MEDHGKHIAEAAEFRGRVLAKLDNIETNIAQLWEALGKGPEGCIALRRQCYQDHLRPMQESVKLIEQEITRLKAWAGILGAVAGAAGSLLVSVIGRHM